MSFSFEIRATVRVEPIVGPDVGLDTTREVYAAGLERIGVVVSSSQKEMVRVHGRPKDQNGCLSAEKTMQIDSDEGKTSKS